MKIDVTTIQGYEEMTPEQKIEALTAFEMDEPDYTGYILKDEYNKMKAQFDKAASELAEMKKQYKARLTDEEQKQAEHDEELETLRQKVQLMEQETAIAEIKANYISMGYDEELATDTARATVEGDNKRIFANHKKFLEAHDKAFEANLIANTPRPEGSSQATPITKEEIMAIKDTTERQQKMAENPSLFGLD